MLSAQARGQRSDVFDQYVGSYSLTPTRRPSPLIQMQNHSQVRRQTSVVTEAELNVDRNIKVFRLKTL